MKNPVPIYEDNVLNKFESFTYNWTMYMVHPQEAHKFEGVINDNRVKILAQSGVEAEINIQSLTQSLVLAFKNNKDRSGLANMFNMQLIEPGGATLFSRILLAADQLDIENHLHACYLLELKFRGYDTNGAVKENPAGPFYYMCSMTALTFDYREGATSYQADLIETHQEAFKKVNLYTKEQLTIEANTMRQFLDILETKINEQEKKQTLLNTTQLINNVYKFGFEDDTQDWANWSFGEASGEGDPKLGNTSVTGRGTLTFTVPQGTQINTIIVVALLHTKEFHKLPTAKQAFHKKNGTDGEAQAKTFAELSSWFVFNTDVKFDLYDIQAKRYAKTISYNLKKFIVQELVHDSISYEKLIRDQTTQTDRIKNIIRNGLLRKRFDYTFTGLNTEVIDLSVTLNNTYYQLQAINHGAISGREQLFSALPEDLQQVAIANSRVDEIQKHINSTKSDIRKAKNELENISDYDRESNSYVHEGLLQRISSGEQELVRQQELLDNAIITGTEALDQLSRANQRLPEQAERYITQSDVQKGSEVFGQAMNKRLLPLTFEAGPVNGTATAGADENESSASLMLGAVELNLNTLSDLIMQQIRIKGDPYWLGRPKGFEAKIGSADGTEAANYTYGGCNYFLNLNFPTYPDPNTGLMDISEQNFGVIGVYRVTRVDATYADGQFTMTLDAFRDNNTNVAMVYETLINNEIEAEEQKTLEEEYKGDEKDSEEDNSDTTPTPDSGDGPEQQSSSSNGGAPGNVVENQSSLAAVRKQSITNDLKAILQNAATETGIDVEVYSGGQPAKGTSSNRTGSTRHDGGRAADVNLFAGTGANRRKLSLDNPADVPLIQSYLASAKKYGATGIGAGNGYMGNDGFHIDNAFPNRPAYWGGQLDSGTYRSRNAPPWLKTIMFG